MFICIYTYIHISKYNLLNLYVYIQGWPFGTGQLVVVVVLGKDSLSHSHLYFIACSSYGPHFSFIHPTMETWLSFRLLKTKLLWRWTYRSCLKWSYLDTDTELELLEPVEILFTLLKNDHTQIHFISTIPQNFSSYYVYLF